MTYPHWSRRMAWHIPKDWDGVTWDCCLLFWPDSPEWTAIIEGHLMSLARGRSWDETTGSIHEVQEIARLISLAFRPSAEAMALPEVANIMSCFTEMNEKLERIAVALENPSSQSEAIEGITAAISPELWMLVKSTKELARILGASDLPTMPPPPNGQ